ncbi:MAG: HAD-IA family hydrolase, partial [Oscillospiraceae bacterium]|nr:HAD-IA family hydrolase [Oscillospiraceae bacterium]
MKYKAILFDLDGTLTDPQLGICQCINYVTEIYGVHKPLNELTKYIGPPLLNSLAELVGSENAEAALARYRERFSTIGLYENEIYPRVDETLETLKEKGYILCTASSKPEIFVRRIMDHFDIAKYFDYIGGASLDESRGAKSDVIKYVLQQINTDNRQVVMVGDTKFDLEGAQKMNMDA